MRRRHLKVKILTNSKAMDSIAAEQSVLHSRRHAIVQTLFVFLLGTTTARAQGHGAKDFSAMVDVVCDNSDIAKPRFASATKA